MVTPIFRILLESSVAHGKLRTMKRTLIAALFNEAAGVMEWWNCLMRQSVQPDEMAIVDGGSTAGT